MTEQAPRAIIRYIDGLVDDVAIDGDLFRVTTPPARNRGLLRQRLSQRSALTPDRPVRAE